MRNISKPKPPDATSDFEDNTLFFVGEICHGITKFVISPSVKNMRAISAFKKAGFNEIKNLNKEEQQKEFGLVEYDNNVLMMKRIL